MLRRGQISIFDEMIKYLTNHENLEFHLAEQISEYIYKDPDLSRISYFDFIDTFKKSKFKIIKNHGGSISKNILERINNIYDNSREKLEVMGLKFIIQK